MNDKSATKLPSNVIAERAIIGACIRSADAYWRISKILRPDHFFVPVHREVFTQIKEICEANQRMSMTLLESRLDEEVDGSSMAAVLAVMIKTADEVETPLDFAEQIVEAAGRRRLIAIGQKLIKEGQSGEKPAIDVAAEAETHILDVMQISSPKHPRLLEDISADVLHSTAETFHSEILPGLVTGIEPIDEMLGLMIGGDLGFIIAARGEGKSALAGQICSNTSRSRPSLYFQFEMSDETMAAREIAAASGVSVGDIRTGNFNQFDFEKIIEAERTLRGRQFYILDSKKMTVRQIRSHALAMKRTTGLGLVVIDQLNKIKAEDRYLKDRFEKFAEITSDLKDLAKDLKVPVIVLDQRTRFGQRRDDYMPQLDDASSPSVEHDADWVIGLAQKSAHMRRNKPNAKASDAEKALFWDQVKQEEGFTDAVLLKHRSRKPFEERKLRWNGRLTRFELAA